MALALVPWIVFVAVAFVQSARLWWDELRSAPTDRDLELQFNVFACCWLAVPVFFFSISQSKLPGYILPGFPRVPCCLRSTFASVPNTRNPFPSGWRYCTRSLLPRRLFQP